MSERPLSLDSETVTGRNGGITLTTTAQLIVPAGKRRKVTFVNNAGSTAYLGSTSGVTAAAGALAGMPLEVDPTAIWVDDETDAAWYGICATGTADLRFYISAG